MTQGRVVDQGEKVVGVMPEELLPTRKGFVLKAQVMVDLVPPRFSGLAMLDKVTKCARTIAKWTAFIILVWVDKGQERL